MERQLTIRDGDKENFKEVAEDKSSIVVSKIPFDSNDKMLLLLNIPENIDEIKIYENLKAKKYNVVKVRVIRDSENEISQRAAFVLFKSEKDAKKLLSMKGKISFGEKRKKSNKFEDLNSDEERFSKKRKDSE